MRSLNDQLKAALKEHLYQHYRVTRMAVKARKIIAALFEAYVQEPRQMPPASRFPRAGASSPERVVADYIAGLTDRSALQDYRKLYDPFARV